MRKKASLLKKTTIIIPDVSQLGRLYQRAVEKEHTATSLAAEQTVLTIGRAEGAIAEARTIAAFLDEV